jgi:hypothetical protein
MLSQTTAKIRLIAFRGESMVLLVCTFPRSTPYKSGTPVLETLTPLSSRRYSPMTTINSTQSYHDSQNWESPTSLKIYSSSRVIGGAL